jgi:beta-lactamase regulating signal transducer with metallopeptidase domain
MVAMLAGEILAALGRVNLAAGAVVLLVLLLRKIVRPSFGARLCYSLWLLPVLAGAAVLIPARQILVVPPPSPSPLAIAAPLFPTAPATSGPPAASPAKASSLPDTRLMILAVWLSGVAGMGLTMAYLQRRFLAEAHKGAIGPAVVGVIRPRIVTPNDFASRFSEEEWALVLAHERAHISRQDSRTNGLAATLQCLCWFNPLVHLGVYLMRIDQEMACDETVVTEFPDARRAYAQALLKGQLAIRPLPLGCYWPSMKQHPLFERIAMLKCDDFSRVRRLAGGSALAALCVATGVAAWASQPPSTAPTSIPQKSGGPMQVASIPPALATATTVATAASDPAGDWQGTLKEEANLRIAVHIERSGDGGYQGALDSPDQGAFGMPLSEIKISGEALSFAVPAVKGRYEARWEGGQWDGRWIQLDGALNMPLSLARGVIPPAPVVMGLDGDWDGTLTNTAGALRLGFHIRTGGHGTSARFDSPDQKTYGAPVSSVSRQGDKVTIEMRSVSARFEGELTDGGKTIAGNFDQFGMSLPLVLTRRPPGAAAPYPPASPAGPATSPKPQPDVVAVDAKVLAGYAGRYALASIATMTITAEDGRLFAQLTNQPKLEIFASAPKEFFWKVVDAQVSFQVGPDGQTTGLVLHQNGRDVAMPRVNPAVQAEGASPAPAAGMDLSGTWSINGVFESGGKVIATTTPFCVFQQASGRLTGTCKGPNAMGTATGTVEGQDVTWQWVAVAYTPAGGSGTATYKGALSPDGAIRGSVTFSTIPGLTGAFTQQRR